MSNFLTGDFDAVIEISVRQIDGILATLHQNRIDPNRSPTFPHSSAVHFSRQPILFEAAESLFGKWLSDSVHTYQSATNKIWNAALLVDKAPPGVAQYISKALKNFKLLLSDAIAGGTLGGWAQIQISSPTLTLPAGSVSHATIHTFIRAHSQPDQDSASWPIPIHGEIRVTYGIRVRQVGGRRVLTVQPPTNDQQIEFLPVPGAALSPLDLKHLMVPIRNALRTKFAPIDVDLPGDFPLAAFKGVNGGPGPAVALPLDLSGTGGDINGVNTHFAGGSDFAIAVSREYIDGALESFRQTITANINALTITIELTADGFWGSIDVFSTVYHATLNSLSWVWKPGSIDISGQVDFKTRSVAPNGAISFTQTITIALDVPSQTISVQTLGDPKVSTSGPISDQYAINKIKSQAAAPLANVSAVLNTIFQNARNNLTNGLKKFDSFGSVNYTSLDLTVDGIVVHGAINTSGRLGPVVIHQATLEGISAFQSWIPGGRITRFDWTWPDGPVWASQVASVSDEHHFVLPTPAAVAGHGRICLRIEGTRVNPDGFPEAVDAGTTCRPFWHEPILTVPAWEMEVLVPIWKPRWPEEGVLNEAIVAHVNVAAQTRVPGNLAPNTLMHFTGNRPAQPLDLFRAAFGQLRSQRTAITLIVILPEGTFRNRRAEVEASLGSLERFPVQLQVTEDYQGGWTKLLAAPEGSSTYLLNGRGEFVWKSDQRLEPARLAAALDEHLTPAPASRMVLLRMAVETGQRALDVTFEDEQGGTRALRRLRGRKVLLNFWKSWSAPSLQELRRLQALSQLDRAEVPIILAVNSGEERKILTEVREKNNLTLPMLLDQESEITTRYGVQCWPTTLSINEEGIIAGIQFGAQEQPARTHEKPTATA